MPENTRELPYSFGGDIHPGFAKIVEEFGETLEVIGKIMMVGGSYVHWTGNLREKLHEELADVQAAIDFYTNQSVNMTPEEYGAFFARRQMKERKFQGWHDDGEELPASAEPEQP